MSEFSYSAWQFAPCVCRNDPRDFTIPDGDLVHFILAYTLPFKSLVGFTEQNNYPPRFVYPAAVLTFRNPKVSGQSAIDSPQSIISVERLNITSMQEVPIEGEIDTINDLFGSLELGPAMIGRFDGETHSNLGDYSGDLSDFDGMVETLLKLEGIRAARDDSARPPFATYLDWAKSYS